MKKQVLFLFGHGLSYTQFSYADLTLDKSEMTDADTLRVTVRVTNTGERAGKAVVQLYIANAESDSVRPVRELRAFDDKVELQPGESRLLTFTLSKRAFAEWNTRLHDWFVPAGSYHVQIGTDAASVVLEQTVKLTLTAVPTPTYTVNSPLGDLFAYPVAKEMVLAAMKQMLGARATRLEDENAADKSGAMSREAMLASAASMPLRSMLSFSANTRRDTLETLIENISQAIRA